MLYSCGIEKNNIMVNFHVASINPFLNLEPTHRWPLCRWSTLGGMLELHGYLHGDLWVAGTVFGPWRNHVSHPTLPEHAGYLQIYFYFKILQCTVCLLSTIQQIPADCFMWIETKLSVSFLKKNTNGPTAPHIAGWWFQPIWKIWVPQLGLLFPIYGKS